jgi:hypothetical protein
VLYCAQSAYKLAIVASNQSGFLAHALIKPIKPNNQADPPQLGLLTN